MGGDSYDARSSRRTYLKGAAAAGTAAVAGCCKPSDFGAIGGTGQETDVDYTVPGSVDELADEGTMADDGVWGAMYFPADAYNMWQTWAEDREDEFERDMGYAADVNLNAVRVFASYEYWQDNPDAFDERFDGFLDIADAYDIQVMPALFESLGDNPSPENVEDPDITTSYAIRSPSWWEMAYHRAPGMSSDAERTPEDFTRYMAEEYGDDERVLALEIMNEPQCKPLHHRFADDMLAAARDANPDATLTMGSREFHFNDRYSTELDIYQFHHNFPETPDDVAQRLEQVDDFMVDHENKEIWLTEWQRAKHAEEPAEQPDSHPSYPSDMLPHYRTVAPLIQTTDRIDGAFFWSLMVKPAYLRKKRKKGRVNGLFHADGSVWSQDDAAWIAGDSVKLDEKQELPDGMDAFV